MTGSENLANAARVVALVMASYVCASAQAALAPRDGQTSAPATGAALAAAQQKLSTTSVPFVTNAGQWDAGAAFAAQTFAGTVFVTKQGELVYSLPGKAADAASPPTSASRWRERSADWALSETLVDANGQPRGMNQGTLKAPSGVHPVESHVSYLTGGNAATVPGAVSAYERVNLGDMYPGVNVQLRATHTKAGSNVEKIFTVAPLHDPKQIQIKLGGAQKLEISNRGELIAHTGNGAVSFTAPIAFQENASGERTPVEVAYALDVAQQSYGFTLGDYDVNRPLVIDPLLASTYLGGANYEQINAIAIHPHSGEVYVTGPTLSSSFPQSGTGAQTSASGFSCFVSRYSADLQQLLQSTYLGNGDVRCLAMAIHPGSGVVYVAGSASGTSTFPAGSMTGAIQTSHADIGNFSAYDGFVALLSADLRTLTKATFFGGVTASQNEQINAIAVHPLTGFVHIAGTTPSSTLPGAVVGTQAAPGGNTDAFTARLPADLMGPAASTVRSTFIGGNDTDFGNALAIDPRSGDVFVAGYSRGGLPPAMLSGAAQGAYAGNGDAFVARLKQDLSAVVRATYLGGTGYEQARSIALHPLTGEVLVAGGTSSSDLPQRAGGAQPAFGGGASDGFVSRLSADLTAILQTTYMGGTGYDWGGVCSVAIHPASGEVFVAGDTDGGLPAALVADGYQNTYGGGSYDAFIVRLNAALTARRAGTYLGGSGIDPPYAIAVEPNGQSVYVGGLNNFGGFPTANAQQGTSGGDGDAFISRFSTDLTAVNRIPNPFSFIHQSNVPSNTTRTSNEVQIVITPTPPDNHQVAYVTGGTNSEFCVTNTAGCCATPLPACSGFATGWINAPYEFLSGDRIAVRHTSANPGGTAETRLIISGTAYPFRSSTGNANIACNLDINGDNVLSHTVEGLILVRAMLGFGADAIVAGTGVPAWNPVRERLNAFCGSNFPFSPSAFQ